MNSSPLKICWSLLVGQYKKNEKKFGGDALYIDLKKSEKIDENLE